MGFSLGRFSIYFDFTFFAVTVLFLSTDAAQYWWWTFSALLLHELGHLVAAKLVGIDLVQLLLFLLWYHPPTPGHPLQLASGSHCIFRWSGCQSVLCRNTERFRKAISFLVAASGNSPHHGHFSAASNRGIGRWLPKRCTAIPFLLIYDR